LYNRECYDGIIEAINGKERILIKGTPGIGKTLFLQRYLVHLVQKASQRALETPFPSIVYAMSVASKTVFYNLHPNSDVSLAEKTCYPDYYLSDSIDSDQAQGKVHLEVASIKDKNYNKFKKRVDECLHGLDINMPVWSFEELMNVRGDVISEAEATFHYAVVGGSARNFLVNFPSGNVISSVVADSLHWIFDGIRYPKEFKSVFDGYCRLISRDLGNTSAMEVFNSLMRHNTNGDCHWASKAMEIIATNIKNHKEATTFIELKAILESCDMGTMFENLAHKKFTRPGFVGSAIPLYQKCARNVDREVKEVLLGFPVMVVLNAKEIHLLEERYYGLPAVHNFPLIDAVIQPNILLQMTASPKSHHGEVGKLEFIREQLSEKDPSKHMMIFVVPKSSLNIFQYNKKLSSIPQYLMEGEIERETETNARREMTINVSGS